MKNWYKNLSLRWKLPFLITMVAIYTATTIAFAVYYLWTDQIKNQVNDRLQQNTELAVSSVHKELDYQQNNLAAWAQLDVMIDIISDDLDKRIITTLNLLKKNYQISGNLIVIDNNNNIIATTNTTRKILKNNKINTANHFILSGDIESSAEIIMRVPINLSILPNSDAEGGNQVGYLILTLPWENVVSQLSVPLKHYLIAKNKSIYHYKNEKLSDKINSATLSFNENYWQINGQKVLHSNEVNLFMFDDIRVNIYGISNKAEAFQPIHTTIKLIGIVLLILLLPIFIVSLWSSNRFLKPIFDLQKVAEEIANSGDLSINIPIYTTDEIGKLALILKKMTKNLKLSFEDNSRSNENLRLLTENLELRVDERTEALSDALGNLKNTQSQLVQSEKMSSLGQLVAGIAHELNNPISSVHVNTPMLKQYIENLLNIIDFSIEYFNNNSEITSDFQSLLTNQLESIDYVFVKEDIIDLLVAQEDAAKRIRDIVLSLRTFSRLDEAEIKSIDINQGIDNTINILKHEIKHRIAIHKDYQLAQNVECFPGEINQVILNILANAAQAIVDNGNIWLSTYSVDNKIARISISDDGPGLPDTLKSKIFDPFFTTKPIGSGTGLGLSISYGIIEKHHGKIVVEDRTPHGATFIIEIPISQEKI